MKRLALAAVVIAACKGPGYRDPGDSEALRAQIDDKNTATRVRIALGEDPRTAPFDSIRVACRDGDVTLSGTVPSHGVKRRAVELARACKGVRGVRDEINVRAASDPR